MMYSFFSTISEYVFGSEDATETPKSATEEILGSNCEQKDDETSHMSPIQTADDRLKKSCYGEVTRLYDGAGVIDDEIYFTFDVAIGGFRPELGSKVHLDAVRDSISSGWKAVRIMSFQEWGSSPESTNIENIISMVENVKGGAIELSDGLTFNINILPLNSFSPCKGDWVKVDLERFTDETFEIRGVKPLRERSFTGCINKVFPGYGFIDEEVYFTFGVCASGYRPLRGDNVKGTAIETGQGSCRWRAIFVEPNRNMVSMQRYE